MITLLESSPDYKYSTTTIPRWYILLDLIMLAGLFCSFAAYGVAYTAPENFPTGELVTVENGSSLSQISQDLKDQGVIRSPRLFNLFVRLLGRDTEVKAGDYFLTEPVTAFEMARRVTSGYFGLTPVWVTIYEGTSNIKIAKLLERRFPRFEPNQFLLLANDLEGYLFPDTYLFPQNVTAEQVITELKDNFFKKVEPLKEKVAESGRSLQDIVVMASLVEKEANKAADRRMIAGVLWSRIEINMLLQVDAVFPYIIGRNTYQVTRKDLKFDSPYNTYVYKGLPPGAITNPGLDSILAALEPTESPYLFYLADRHGNTYYAKDYTEHKKNRRKYLNR